MLKKGPKISTPSVPVRSIDATAFAERLELMPDVWARIQAHNLRNVLPLRNAILESNEPFLKDSAGSLGGKWLENEVERMIDEYERYMLVMRLVDGAFLAPTIGIDYVWHAHLGFSAHYSEVWCTQVLEMVIPHHPGLGRGRELAAAYKRYRAYHVHLFDFPPQEKWRLFRSFGPDFGLSYEVKHDGSIVGLGDCG